MKTGYPTRRVSSTFVISMLAGAALVATGLSIGHEHPVRAAVRSHVEEPSLVQFASAPRIITLERVVVIGHRSDVATSQ